LRFDAIGNSVNGELLAPQFFADKIRERGVIFGDKYPHASP
jgi:hypothetical protein